jgi:hypothetical protein
MAIYYLDVDDEITSAAARIRDSSDTRIALVLTGGARVATSRINFRLLAGEAKRRHKRLAIVTADKTVQSVARSAGLFVFGTVGEYERAEATRAAGRPSDSEDDVSEALGELAATVVVQPGGKQRRAVAGGVGSGGSSDGARSARTGRIPWRLTAALGFLTAVALASGLFFFYPSASVTLTVREEQVGPVTYSATIDPGVIAADDQAGIVPGVKKAFPVSASGTFDATGQKVTETPAGGTVTFDSINTLFAVPVIAGTRLTTASGIAFITGQTVSVPRATVSGTRITHGSASTPVQAVTPGVAGNVAAGAIVRVPADLAAAQVTVSNAQPTTGGTHTVTPIVQQSDIDGAETAMMATLNGDFQDAVTAPEAAPSGATLFAISAKLGISIFSPDPQAMVGQEVASFELNASATGTAVVADMAAVGGLAKSRVDQAVDTGFTLVDGSVTTAFGAPVLRGDTIQVPVTANARQARKLDESSLRAAIKGKSVEDAKAYLAQFGVVQISVSPGWASTMPAFDFRIDFHLVEATASPGGSPSASTSPVASAAHVTAAPRRTTTPGETSAPSEVPSTGPGATPPPTAPPASAASAGPTG